MVNSHVLLAASGLLALSSAAPAASGSKPPCIDGAAIGVIRFDDVKQGTKLDKYAGFEWAGVTIAKTPYPENLKPGTYNTFGSTPPNAAAISNGKNGGGLGLNVGPEQENFGIISFTAACAIPNKKGGQTFVDCDFMSAGDSGGTASNKSFKYTVKKNAPGFELFTPFQTGGLSGLAFHVTSGEVNGVKPTLYIDNVEIQNLCGVKPT